MSRHAARPLSPANPAAALPAQVKKAPGVPRARPVAQARPDGAIVETTGSMDQLTPMQEQGLRDAAQLSPNLAFNEGGAPVFTVVDEEAPAVPPPQRFRVVKDKDVALNGHRFKLRAGKEVDAANYDIPQLRRYGVELEPIDANA